MPPEETTPAADPSWTVESFSAPADPAPSDTTVGREEAGARAEGSEATETPSGESASAGETPTSGVSSPPPKKRKQTFQERIDELTGQRHSVERDLAAERARREALEARLDTLERGTTPAAAAGATTQPAASVSHVSASVAAAPMPTPPKYLDFESDEAYQAALTAWNGAMASWQTSREEALATRLRADLDQRFDTERQTAIRMAHEAAVNERARAMHAAHPDFAEHLEANAEVFNEIKSPFLQDIVVSTDEGFELLNDLARTPAVALALGALPLPSRPLADAVRASPQARAIMKHFASDEGRLDFMRLRALHPVRVLAEIGRLEARLEAAVSGPASEGVTHPITQASPPAKPPGGTPRPRGAPASPSAAPTDSFEDWYAAEQKRKLSERLRAAGLPTPA